MVHLAKTNHVPPPCSMLQYIGRVATSTLMPRNCLRYLQTTLAMEGGGLVSEFMRGIVARIYARHVYVLETEILTNFVSLICNTFFAGCIALQLLYSLYFIFLVKANECSGHFYDGELSSLICYYFLVCLFVIPF